MKPRIITHGHCLDGFSSAFMFKKYFCPILGLPADMEVITVSPTDVELELVEICEMDIVLDLPRPKIKVAMWIDHHTTNRPTEEVKDYYWRLTPSCTGLMVDLLVERGVALPPSVLEFRKVLDKVDMATYTLEEYKECFFAPADWGNLSLLQQTIVVSTLFQTRDRNLNDEMIKYLLGSDLGEIPTLCSWFESAYAMVFYRAYLQSLEDWRTFMDQYFVYDPLSKCVIQDDRKLVEKRGLADRFYVYYKFLESSYGLNIKQVDERTARVGFGCNVFFKVRNKVDVGAICKQVGREFGEGSGGGHREVGGATVLLEKADAAVEFILKKLREAA